MSAQITDFTIRDQYGMARSIVMILLICTATTAMVSLIVAQILVPGMDSGMLDPRTYHICNHNALMLFTSLSLRRKRSCAFSGRSDYFCDS